jgi:cysteine desulfuration protein SufE
MSNIQAIEKEIIEDFALFEDWEGKYEYLIDMAKSLPKIEEKFKVEDNIIKGCQSRVWLHSEKRDDKIFFTADSDAIITKGMVALMVRVLSNQTPSDIVQSDLNFINAIGLKENLSPTRANGLVSMIRRMKEDALRLS